MRRKPLFPPPMDPVTQRSKHNKGRQRIGREIVFVPFSPGGHPGAVPGVTIDSHDGLTYSFAVPRSVRPV
jgi:hypothetical protein